MQFAKWTKIATQNIISFDHMMSDQGLNQIQDLEDARPDQPANAR